MEPGAEVKYIEETYGSCLDGKKEINHHLEKQVALDGLKILSSNRNNAAGVRFTVQLVFYYSHIVNLNDNGEILKREANQENGTSFTEVICVARNPDDIPVGIRANVKRAIDDMYETACTPGPLLDLGESIKVKVLKGIDGKDFELNGLKVLELIFDGMKMSYMLDEI